MKLQLSKNITSALGSSGNLFKINKGVWLVEHITTPSQENWENSVGNIQHKFFSQEGDLLSQHSYFGSYLEDDIKRRYCIQELTYIEVN